MPYSKEEEQKIIKGLHAREEYVVKKNRPDTELAKRISKKLLRHTGISERVSM